MTSPCQSAVDRQTAPGNSFWGAMGVAAQLHMLMLFVCRAVQQAWLFPQAITSDVCCHDSVRPASQHGKTAEGGFMCCQASCQLLRTAICCHGNAYNRLSCLLNRQCSGSPACEPLHCSVQVTVCC